MYRSILKLHAQHLPMNMRLLGDAYVKNEFKLHKNVTNETQNMKFLQGWMSYLTTMKEKFELAAVDDQKVGSHLPHDAPLTDDQRNNLQKLKQEAYNLSNGPYDSVK